MTTLHPSAAQEVKHFSCERRSVRLLGFWGGRGLSEQSGANFSELLTRADLLIDALEMLCPQDTPAQRSLVREAIGDVQRVASLANGVFVLADTREAQK